MILLTGVTGRVGGACARQLQADGVPMRALGRGEAPPEGFQGEWVQGDLRDSGSVARAFPGISKALLVAPNTEDQVAIECGFADQAAEAGVDLLLKVSSTEVGPDVTAPFPAAHYAIEQHIEGLGVPACMLRPDFYYQNLLMSAAGIKAAGVFRYPFGDAAVAPVDAREVGEAAARVLAGDGHAGQAYTLTGPALLDFHQVASQMSEGLGREIRYEAQDPDAYRTFLAGIIPDAWHAEAVCTLFDEIREKHRSAHSDALAQLLGREPKSVAAFAAEHAAAFNP